MKIWRFKRETPIYIDCELGDGVRGEKVAMDVSEKGFQNIFITTGYESSEIKAPSCVKAILSKDFPMKSHEAREHVSC